MTEDRRSLDHWGNKLDPFRQPRAHQVRDAMADKAARSSAARQESIGQAFARFLRTSQTDTRVHGVLHRKRVDPNTHRKD